MDRSCVHCNRVFTVTDEDLAFLEKLSPRIGGSTLALPHPTHCPDCRQQRRLLWRNERTLYRRTCSRCGKSVIAMYPKDAPFPVYCTECWWSDHWDPLAFGRDVDFSRPFFDQVKELQNVVPRLALNVVNNENSDFVNLSGSNKNCYLLFAAEFNEDCLYGYQVIKSQNCVDTSDCTESQECYDVIDVDQGNALFFSQNCTNCSGSAFLFDCKGCMDCLFSMNLRNKQYCFQNVELPKDEYQERKAELFDRIAKGGLPEVKKEFDAFVASGIHRSRIVVNCENVTGDYLKHSKNLRHCFDVSYGEDCAYVYTGFQIRDLLDVCHTTDAQLGYDSMSLGYGSYNALFTHGSWSGKNLLYCDVVQSGSDMFGCVFMKAQKHCILNKQYTKEEYEHLVPKVIAHMRSTQEWGEFFPGTLSPFAYNETTAQMYFPMTKAEATKRGFRWREHPGDIPDVPKVVPAGNLPPSIEDVPDEILEWAVSCEATRRPFRIVKPELQFYREHGLPLPHLHPDERHFRRMAKRNPRKLWQRPCARCGENMETTYAPERKEKVLCENCFLKEVY